jgi:branched-chain amino acid transport system ATP-binding protein
LRPIFTTPRQVREADDRVHARAVEVLEISHLAPVRDEYAANLSGGQKKLLELARTLMIDCSVVLLDEPGAGVNPALMNTLRGMIQELNRDHGKTFLIVEHDMDMIAALCDPVIVMTEGRRLIEGSFDEIRRDPRVIEAYLGGAA